MARGAISRIAENEYELTVKNPGMQDTSSWAQGLLITKLRRFNRQFLRFRRLKNDGAGANSVFMAGQNSPVRPDDGLEARESLARGNNLSGPGLVRTRVQLVSQWVHTLC
jgi:hypothetical protein